MYRVLSICVSPWYSRHSYLGVKNQASVYYTLYVIYVSMSVILSQVVLIHSEDLNLSHNLCVRVMPGRISRCDRTAWLTPSDTLTPPAHCQLKTDRDCRCWDQHVFCFVFVFAKHISVGRLFRNIHPSLQYSSRARIHTSLYDFLLACTSCTMPLRTDTLSASFFFKTSSSVST